jgi:hypothetical protein
MSVTWWRRRAVTGAPARSAPHPRHAAGGQSILSSGSSARLIVIPGSPGCFPGRRFPRSRSERSLPFFLYGLSEEGGRDDVDESLRACHSSSSTRPDKRSTCEARRPACAVSSAISWYASASRTASSAAGRADSSFAEGTPGTAGTTGNDHHSGQPINNPARRVATHRPQSQPPTQGRPATAIKPSAHVNSYDWTMHARATSAPSSFAANGVLAGQRAWCRVSYRGLHAWRPR